MLDHNIIMSIGFSRFLSSVPTGLPWQAWSRVSHKRTLYPNPTVAKSSPKSGFFISDSPSLLGYLSTSPRRARSCREYVSCLYYHQQLCLTSLQAAEAFRNFISQFLNMVPEWPSEDHVRRTQGKGFRSLNGNRRGLDCVRASVSGPPVCRVVLT